MGCVAVSDSNASEGDAEIDKLYFPPTTPIRIVFDAVVKCCGVSDDYRSSDLSCIETLNKLWYYRSYDLINVNTELWDTFEMPIILETQLLKYIKNCKTNDTYINFKEPIPQNKNITNILNNLETENKSESTSNDIKILTETLNKLYLLNIEKLKKYLTEEIFNEINVPEYLKVILLQKINHQFEGQIDNNIFIKERAQGNNKYQKVSLFPDMKEVEDDMKKATDRGDEENNNENILTLPVTCTMEEVCSFITDELFVDKDKISNDLKVFSQFNYKRLYHLSRINDSFFDTIMCNVPKCLKNELYDMITNMRRCHLNPLPFYNYNINSNKKRISTVNINDKEIDINLSMQTYEIYEILENDLSLSKGELSEDCDLMMNNFYSNLWDWYFIPNHFWKQLPYFNTYYVIRNRIDELMKLCMQKYNMNENEKMPILPELWLNKFDANLSVEQILFGGNKKQFMFDGLNWNENTAKHIKLISEYFNKNYIGKLQFIAAEHCKKNDTWTEYMNKYRIPSHFRFKINFYSVKGNIHINDQWLNEYIKTNYFKLPPQYDQQMNINMRVPIPVFSIENISADHAEIRFAEKYKYECYIEIMESNWEHLDEKESNWKHLVKISDKKSYLCQNLKSNNSYQIKARFKDGNLFGRYSEIKTFETNDASMPFNVGPNGNKWKFSNGNIIEKICIDGYFTTCVIGESISNKMCTQFDFEIKLKTITNNCCIGYILYATNWNCVLGHAENSYNSLGLNLNPNQNYISEYRNGNHRTLNYRAPSNFKSGDRFKLSFHFVNNQLTIYHNESKVEILSLDNYKKITPAISIYNTNDKIEIVKCDIIN